MSKADEEDNSNQIFAALVIGGICLVVGLPVWWHTTTVYRAPIPYNDIEQLSSKKITFQTDVIFVMLDEEYNTKKQAASILQKAEAIKQSFQHVDSDKIGFRYRLDARKSVTEEQEALSQKSLEELERQLQMVMVVDDPGMYRVYVMPRHVSFAPRPDTVVLGRHRSLFVSLESGSEERSLRRVLSLLTSLVVDEAALSDAAHRHFSPRSTTDMRVVPASSDYDVTFSLVNPDPAVTDARWEIEPALESYVMPLTRKLKEFAAVHVKSQVLLYTSFATQPTKADDGSHVLHPNQLPQLINPLESKLSSHVSQNPQLNFLLYITRSKHNPLYIVDRNGVKTEGNALISARWGGIVIHNPPLPTGDKQSIQYNIDLDLPLRNFVSQLKLLIGLPSLKSEESVEQMPADNSLVTDLEVDQWLRGRVLEQFARTCTTLTSLANLLGKIRNMVISDEIANQVSGSVESLAACLRHARRGDLRQAHLSSQAALTSAEKAFFDASLLQLLYFPEDQKFAIYIPLFLPISLPVFASLKQALSWLRSRNAKSKTD